MIEPRNVSVDLHRFIGQAAGGSHRLSDCSMWPADWCMVRGHVDPAARWRGKYDDGGAALVRKWGLLDLWMLGMIDAQIPEADEPIIGDVGVVVCLTDDGLNQCGAIYGGKRWHALAPKGVFQASMPALKVWRVG